MKRIYIVIAWILGICYTFLSVILLAVAPIGTALSIIALFAFLMTGLILSIRKQQSAASTTPEPVLSIHASPRLLLDGGKGVQLLESIQIIETTHNLRTLDTRIEFIIPLYEQFLVHCRFDIYGDFVRAAIDRYNTMYPDRTLSSDQLRLLSVPNRNEMLSFISRSIACSYASYVRLQQAQIGSLVRPSAKLKRYEAIKAQRSEFLALYSRYSIPEQENRRAIELLAIE